MEMWHRACPLCFSGIQDQTIMATDCIGSGTLTSRQTMSSDKSARARSGSWASQVARNSSSSRVFSSLSHALRLRQLSQSAECVVRELRPSTRRRVRFNKWPNNAGDEHAAYARPAWMEQRNRFIAALMEPGQCQHQAEKASPSGVYLSGLCLWTGDGAGRRVVARYKETGTVAEGRSWGDLYSTTNVYTCQILEIEILLLLTNSVYSRCIYAVA
jgi:hypothetical protein